MDLLGRYSNLRELQEELKALARELDKQPPVAREPQPMPYVHKLERRLGRETIEQIVADYRAGTTSTQLIADYGISKTGILRLLHEAGAIRPGKRNQPMRRRTNRGE